MVQLAACPRSGWIGYLEDDVMGRDNFSFEKRRKEMEKKAKKEEKKKRKLNGDATPSADEVPSPESPKEV